MKEIVDKVLMQLLGRKPTPEDYRKVEKAILKGDAQNWRLSYDGNILGWINTEFKEEEGKYSVVKTFTPLKDWWKSLTPEE